MKTSENVKQAIKDFEGCILTAYQCAGNVYTIGYGHTGADVVRGMKITQEMANVFFNSDIQKAEEKVSEYNNRYNWTQNEFDALVSFTFNIGNIDGLTKNGTRTKGQIAEKIPAYNKAGGKVLGGLVQRRCYEQQIFKKQSVTNDIAKTYLDTILKKGDKGHDVRILQQRLIMIDALRSDAEDGIYGLNVENIIKALQYNAGIKVDGICGKQTHTIIQVILDQNITYSEYVEAMT